MVAAGVSLDLGLSSRGVPSQTRLFPAASKKYVYPPIGGCAPTVSSPLFRRDWAEQPVAPYFDTDADCQKLLVAIATGGFEVLVNYALHSIGLTNQFLRFPRVRQQPRGNFFFSISLAHFHRWWNRIGGSSGARFVIRFPR